MFRLEHIEDLQQPGHAQGFVDPALDVDQFEHAALVLETGVGVDEGPDASASHVKDVGQIQQDVRSSLEYQLAQLIAQDEVRVVLFGELSLDVDDRHVADSPVTTFTAGATPNEIGGTPPAPGGRQQNIRGDIPPVARGKRGGDVGRQRDEHRLPQLVERLRRLYHACETEIRSFGVRDTSRRQAEPGGEMHEMQTVVRLEAHVGDEQVGRMSQATPRARS